MKNIWKIYATLFLVICFAGCNKSQPKTTIKSNGMASGCYTYNVGLGETIFLDTFFVDDSRFLSEQTTIDKTNASVSFDNNNDRFIIKCKESSCYIISIKCIEAFDEIKIDHLTYEFKDINVVIPCNINLKYNINYQNDLSFIDNYKNGDELFQDDNIVGLNQVFYSEGNISAIYGLRSFYKYGTKQNIILKSIYSDDSNYEIGSIKYSEKSVGPESWRPRELEYSDLTLPLTIDSEHNTYTYFYITINTNIECRYYGFDIVFEMEINGENVKNYLHFFWMY